MSTATINGVSVLRGRVTLRLVGAWDAEVWIDGTDTDVVAGRCVLELGGVPMVGFGTPGKDAGGRVSVRVVGGAGGLETVAGPQGYVNATRRLVLADALAVGGEALSPLSDATVDAALPHWSRRSGKVKDAVRRAVEHAGDGTHWRVLLDGTVWVGTETWLPLELDGDPTEESPTNDRLVFPVESAVILPGVTFRGIQVAGVRYELTGRSLRAHVTGGEKDELAGHLSALVKRETAGKDLDRTFVARIVAQNADGTLELKLGDSAMPGLSRVPVRLGIPGVSSYQIAPGIDCSLEYENGDPSRPFVSSFDSGQALSLTVSAATLVKLEGAQVEAGGQLSLVLHDIFAGIWSSLAAAGAPIGLSVPPLVGANSTILKGA